MTMNTLIIFGVLSVVTGISGLEYAVVAIHGSAHGLYGKVEFIETYTGGHSSQMKGSLTGMNAGQKYCLYIHKFGDITDGCKASRLGSIFNPTGASENNRLGDLGCWTADATGKIVIDKTYPDISLCGYKSLEGRSLAVKASDGDTVACGVVGHSIYDKREWCDYTDCCTEVTPKLSETADKTVEECKLECRKQAACGHVKYITNSTNGNKCEFFAKNACGVGVQRTQDLCNVHNLKDASEIRTCDEIYVPIIV